MVVRYAENATAARYDKEATELMRQVANWEKRADSARQKLERSIAPRRRNPERRRLLLVKTPTLPLHTQRGSEVKKWVKVSAKTFG